MKGILYYLKHYGNVGFDLLRFNEVDSLIMAQLSYLNLELFTTGERTYLKDVVTQKNARLLSVRSMLHKRNEELCRAFEKTTRYNNVYYSMCVNELDEDKLKQFFAVTFFIEDFMYVAYRGTDLTIAGWQEDYLMSYDECVPSHLASSDYLSTVYEKYRRPFYIGGHSKGGNLALYAALFSGTRMYDDIIGVHMFDSPGFSSRDVFNSHEYKVIEPKILNVSANVSIVAMLLYHADTVEFVSTKGFWLLQHSAFNWRIKNFRLKRIKRNKRASRLFARIVEAMMDEFSVSEKRRFGELFFYIAKDNPKSSLLDIKRRPVRYLIGIIKRSRTLSREDIDDYRELRKKARAVVKRVVLQNIFRKSKTF